MKQYLVTDFVEKIAIAPNKLAVWETSQNFFEQFGFDGLIYIDAKNDNVDLLTTFPDYWLRHYLESNYQTIDPFFDVCCTSFSPMPTGADNVDLYPQMSKAATAMILESGETGFKVGVSSPFRLLSAEGAGGWNLLSSHSSSDIKKTWDENENAIQLATFCAHLALRNYAIPDPNLIQLSPKEKECLKFLASGLRTQEIAHRLGVKPVTVEFHFKNVRKKLNASTRDQALARAIMQGLISI